MNKEIWRNKLKKFTEIVNAIIDGKQIRELSISGEEFLNRISLNKVTCLTIEEESRYVPFETLEEVLPYIGKPLCHSDIFKFMESRKEYFVPVQAWETKDGWVYISFSHIHHLEDNNTVSQYCLKDMFLYYCLPDGKPFGKIKENN